ncbi:MAG TPA: GNAT family N-acetyltransferase [Gemmatimonadaceae bacterium]|nr:GNAT family N-acetyltransferase [Gemmatimonadaceae bacterium]
MTVQPAPVWNWAHFRDLAPGDLYDILALRTAVFIVEQNCAYQDADGADQVSHHLWTRDANGEIAASLRVVPPGVKYTEPSLGRIVTAATARGTGLGRAVVQEGIARIATMYGPCAIRIGAQRYLLRFYEQLGFVSTGREYDEDEIPHTEMLRPAAR